MLLLPACPSGRPVLLHSLADRSPRGSGHAATPARCLSDPAFKRANGVTDGSSSLVREMREVLLQGCHFGPKFLEPVLCAFPSECEDVR